MDVVIDDSRDSRRKSDTAEARRNRGAGGPPGFAVSVRYRRYLLGLLAAVGVMGWIDRNVLAAVLESIKLDMGLSDTELGLLGGVAFGLFYAAVGLPVARFADRGNRRNLIALALGLWSVMTVLCGGAGSFSSLFLARVGVGVGEAGGSPPSQSLISDYFPPERRAFALGVYYLYIPLGFLAGYASGGWLDELVGWRLAFVLVGLPGVLLALVLRFTLREPPRAHADGSAEAEAAANQAAPPLHSSLKYLLSRPSLRHLPVAGALNGIGAFAASVWLPAYFIRVFGFSSAEAGTWVALAYGLGGGAGVLAGGYLADRIVRRSGDERWYAWGSAAMVAAIVPPSLLIYLTHSAGLAVAALLVATFFGHSFLGPVTALVQGLAGVRRRAVAAALYLFLVNLVSAGVGPLAVGLVSDLLGPRFGADALRWALLVIVALVNVWSAAHFLCAAKTLRADFAQARLG
ncbi:MAG TPA: MFS transporter [Gammaproteobacteria bacterium]|nr:MFS transporter [Gammaproteobacteria bacterium]